VTNRAADAEHLAAFRLGAVGRLSGHHIDTGPAEGDV